MRHPPLDVEELQTRLAASEFTPLSIIERCAKHVQAWEPRVGALVGKPMRVLLESAREEARRLTESRHWQQATGPLYGIPIAYKDIIDVAGYPTEGGCRAYANRTPNRDASLVARYRAAGSIVFGKTSTHELAAGVTTPQTNNPYRTGYVAGGSSGGSAVAVACGMVPVAIGSDTGGSGRIPAAFCGVVGFKPTYGHISLDGFMERAASLDTVAFLGQSVGDVRLLYQVARDTEEPVPPSAGGSSDPSLQTHFDTTIHATRIRVGFPEAWVKMWCTSEIRSHMNQLLAYLESQGVECVPVKLPDLHWAMQIRKAVLLPEFASAHRASFAENPSLFGPDVALQIERGWETPAPDYVRGIRDMVEFAGAWCRACNEAGVTVVIAPTTPCVAPTSSATSMALGEASSSLSVADALTLFTSPVNLTRMPAISLPTGMGTNGIPFGLQVVGRVHEDLHLLCVAESIFRLLQSVSPVSPPGCD